MLRGIAPVDAGEHRGGLCFPKIRDRMSTLRIGPPLDKAIDIGAIVARVQLERIQRMVAQGVAEGATCWQPKTRFPRAASTFPPTILSNVHPTSIVAQQEIFGPVLAAMTFRTPREAVELANNTVYGLASCVWSENINVALHVAAQIKAGVVWVNCTNLFDAACGFGGYRESGYGREGGREGLARVHGAKVVQARSKTHLGSHRACPAGRRRRLEPASIDRPHDQALYRGQAGAPGFRLQHGSSIARRSLARRGSLGNRKDIRNAVEAARKAEGWAESNGAQSRAGTLLLCGESLAAPRRSCSRLAPAVGEQASHARSGSRHRRIFSYAAWADKFDGAVHNPPFRNIAIAMNEPIGTVGVICPSETPLLGFLSLVMPLLAVGNTVIAMPSEKYPLITGDLYQLFDTSDLPGGAVNIVTGYVSQLLKRLPNTTMWTPSGATAMKPPPHRPKRCPPET